jgi:predicted dehydrogenase
VSTFRWGIFGTGFVATKFALSLKMLPGVEIVAVASRSKERAQDFAKGIDSNATVGTYEEIANLENIDAIYIATPPNLHRAHALLCINARKPVLIEKPMALNSAEAEEIAETAIANDIFCMEAMWTRFTPLIQKVKQMSTAGYIGDVRLITGSFCMAEQSNSGNHLFNAEMGGGVLLDRLVYPISLAIHLMGIPDKISGQVQIGDTGVDEQSAVTLGWRNKCIAQFQASLVTNAQNDFMIAGSKAKLHIQAPIYRPTRMKVTSVIANPRPPRAAPSRKDAIRESHLLHQAHQILSPLLPMVFPRKTQRINAPYMGNAYHYQAEEVVKCISSGKLQSDIMPLNESIAVLKIVDKLREIAIGDK